MLGCVMSTTSEEHSSSLASEWDGLKRDERGLAEKISLGPIKMLRK